MEHQLHVALVNPEIGPNTGNIGRLCLGIGARLHLVHPLGFQINDKQVRRAVLDYWKNVSVVEHPDPDAFARWMTSRRFHLMSTRGQHAYTRIAFQPGDVLVFGCESKGLPRDWVDKYGAYRIPMPGPIRSLNLANSVSIVAMHAMQQLHPELFDGDFS